MNYKEAIAYIEEIPKFTKKNKLSHTRACLNRLGNPDRNFDVVHVAGSNGKGSVCAMTASVLQEAGYKVGLFISPHLVKTNERFHIDGEDVSDEAFLEAFEEVYQLSLAMVEEGSYHPTYFEFLFLMGMVLFARAGVEIAVLETGLGGKLDATNTVERPVACVITSISLEHTEYLGDTVEAIAGEKAGIIKPGAAVIYEGFQDGVSRVIEEKAAESGNRTIGLKPDMYEIIRNTDTTIDFSLKSSYYGGAVITIPFVAPYQVINASLALLTLEVLAKQYNLPLETIRRGIRNTRWEGRMETVLPGVIVDGAHNDDGVRRFVETAKRFEDKDITLLFSAVVEKDYPAMIHRICSELHFSKVVTTQIDGARVVPAEELADLFRGNGCENVTAKEKIKEAFDEAYEEKGDGLLFCVGSLYLVGEIKDYIRRSYE
ncbi:MAG: folylpolyglutamate synthase/dihydrofolate synthase family protein [Lachnospiraceae bacterium]|nr:folylpolyglutamate synthase/dihydrofolate synthase family protein [Lachnospiraceae bacterium]